MRVAILKHKVVLDSTVAHTKHSSFKSDRNIRRREKEAYAFRQFVDDNKTHTHTYIYGGCEAVVKYRLMCRRKILHRNT